MNDQVPYDHVAHLAEITLDDPNIVADQHLSQLLIQVRNEALKHRRYYDYKNEFRPAISFFTLQHHNKISPELLELLKYVKTPNAWSGF